MSMAINHNIAALDAWRNLSQTNQMLNKSLEKLSSGFKINRASDNPAGLVISEQMRAQIAGLTQAIDNTETATSMVQTAEAALSTIHGMLDKMRQLAIHAANEGANDPTMLAADQADIENAMSSITRIANTTQFGTKKLLDGSRASIVNFTTGNTAEVSVSDTTLTTGTHILAATKTADASATLSTSQFGLSSPTNVTNLEAGNHTLQVTQASAGASKTSSSDIRITDAWDKGLAFSSAAAAARLSGTFSNSGTSAGDSLTIGIAYQGADGVIHSATISASMSAVTNATAAATALNAALNGSGLSGYVVFSGVAGSSSLTLESKDTGSNESIKVVTKTVGGNVTWGVTAGTTDRGVAKRSGVFTMALDGGTATKIVMAANTYTSIADLATAVQKAISASLGAADAVTVSQDGSNNRITITTKDEGSKATLQVTGTDSGNELGLSVDTAALTGIDALVSFDGYVNTIDNVQYGSTGTATLANGSGSSAGTVTLKVASANEGVDIGTMVLNVTPTQFNVTLDGGAATSVAAGTETTVYNAQHDQYIKVTYALDSGGGTETLNVSDQSLVFQVGANKNQTVKISLQSMKTADLGKNVSGNMFSSLADINVTTATGAQDALEVIDKAINDVSHARDVLGAFQKNTLEENAKSLKIANQNLTAAESQIRDTDFAKEMSVFTKNQILLQSGTAMLAQANTVPQIVLQLLR